jgi:hypothetical protein
MIGGEGPANAAWMVAGTWIQAKTYKTNGLLIFPFTFCQSLRSLLWLL